MMTILVESRILLHDELLLGLVYESCVRIQLKIRQKHRLLARKSCITSSVSVNLLFIFLFVSNIVGEELFIHESTCGHHLIVYIYLRVKVASTEN